MLVAFANGRCGARGVPHMEACGPGWGDLGGAAQDGSIEFVRFARTTSTQSRLHGVGPPRRHSAKRFSASAICWGVIFAATRARFVAASLRPPAAAKLNHICAAT